ncbi:MAG: DUF4837 family protein [Marinilabiliales bacterium]|nr:MAG: DUF4837 family protein [Marinilabiliales bacterium]
MEKKNKKVLFLLSMTAAIVILASCRGDRSPLLPNVTGRAGEVVVVMNAPLWEAEPGRTLGKTLESEHPGLIQYEPMFNVVRIGHAAFSNIFKTHRNIVIVNVSSQATDTRMNIRKNVWARPQTILEITSTDAASLNSFLENQRERILEEFVTAERERIVEYHRTMERISIRERLQEKFNISMVVPAGYNIVLDTADFIWIRHDPRRLTQDIIQGIFVYQFDYTDPETFTPDFLVGARNRFLRRYIEGPSAGSWMSTEALIPPDFDEFMDNGRYFAMLRGLWRVENDFMGGPFVSYITLDEPRNKVIVAEAFVYVPGDRKRNLLRQVEAIISTLEVRDQKQDDDIAGVQ